MEESQDAVAAASVAPPSPKRSTPCNCSKRLGGPSSLGSMDRRRTWCEGEALLSPTMRASWRLGASLRALAALSPELKEETEEEEEDTVDLGLTEAPPRARRALSLPDDGCCRKCKKRVQFADSLGLTLASVKHYSDSEEPQVPAAVLSRLQEDAGPAPEPRAPEAVFQLVRDFAGPPPGGLRPEHRVCLERASGVEGPFAGAPQVWVLARGPGPTSVRYTFNNWLSFMDSMPEGPGEMLQGGVRRLCFTLYAPPTLRPGECMQFAIRNLEEGGGESWDNNGGRNYTLRYEVCSISDPD